MNLLQGTELLEFIIDKLEDSKAQDIITIDDYLYRHIKPSSGIRG